ncbi:MAG: helix-turn-helix domain-containing protein [Planctomycetes bacterium]|nr:helix-turn-helix domain-containing protein [Planctomycetota bacterium]
MPDTPRIALLIETSTSYGRGLLRGIGQYAQFHGPWSFYIEPGELAGKTPDLKGWGVQGIIARIHTQTQARQILAAKVPTVDLDFVLPQLFPWGLTNNDTTIGRLAAEHLISCGLSNFAYVGWAPADQSTTFWDSARGKAFDATIAAAGSAVAHYTWPKAQRDWTWAREQKHLAQWLAELPKPVGVMAANDQRARHVLEAARIAGLDLPRELAVIGVDNDEVLCEMSSPSLSSVAVNTPRIGYEAAAMLDKLMASKKVSDKPVVIEPLGIVARQSTDTLAMDDAEVVAALRYIRRNIDKPIRVSDVLKAVNISRKTLEVRFAKALGRTPHSEIHRVRLERVKNLLVQSDWSLKKIATASGFTYAEHMHAVFRKETGATPNEYRAQHREH